MAVFKNYYNRKSYWLVAACCLYLLCSTITCGAERTRHRHVHQVEESPKDPLAGCPNCLYKSERSEADRLRLEAIKRQILSKLGLRQKPNVTHSLPKEVIWETLYRAEDENGDGFLRAFEGDENDRLDATSAKSPVETVDVDDFYGRTSEIIAFADEGSRVNQNRVLEFRATVESGQVGQEFTVRAATLWLKADLLQHHAPNSRCRSTDIYVFKIISNRLPESVTLSSRQFDRVTSDPVTIALDESHSGWQKIDLTETVRSWLADESSSGGREKLRLFVDCSCCSNWRVHLLNAGDRERRSNDPDRPFLVIHTDPNAAKRVRKRAIDCSVDSGNQCCKQRFYVSFKALGWDNWVIAPQGYYANYCRGDCGHHRTPDTYATYHTNVMEEVRHTQHLSGMTPCCAPLKFSSMSLIYFDRNNTIIKRDLPKMVVDECGCP